MRIAILVVGILFSGCATTDGSADEGVDTAEITSSGAWYHLDAASGLGPATVTVVNGYKVKCPNGVTARTCHVSALVMPADCGWECQDGVLSLQGEALLRDNFINGALVVTTGMDTYTHDGLGAYSAYELTAPPTCAADPCPASLTARKLNVASAGTKVTSVDFSQADDPNYVLDPTRGDDQALSAAHLIASGHIVSHVFRADRVWRLETPRPTCDPQLVARGYADPSTDVVQFRTVAVAERAQAPDGEGLSWLVRTGESPTTVTFTSGRNDLWAQQFDIAKSTCAITVTHEH